MSACCFNQVESWPRSDLQLVERAGRTHGPHYEVKAKSVKNNCFPTPVAKVKYFYVFMSTKHTHNNACVHKLGTMMHFNLSELVKEKILLQPSLPPLYTTSTCQFSICSKKQQKKKQSEEIKKRLVFIFKLSKEGITSSYCYFIRKVW